MRDCGLLPRRPATPPSCGLPLALAVIAALASGCGGGGTTPPPDPGPDVTPPARVSDLYVRATTDTSATLTWIAPGDDGASGRAAQYEIRRAATPITASTWSAALPVTAPTPAAAGARETLVVTGLTTGQEWWFALRAADEIPNWSPLSNAPSARATGANGRTWRVRLDGGGDVPTIQAAIDSAGPGDLVLVADGVYTWRNQHTTSGYAMLAFFNGKHGFTVRSESGPAATVLDCESLGRGVWFGGVSVMTMDVVLEGFTIRNGRATQQLHYAGGGLFGHLSACTVRDCVFTNCVAFAPAAGDSLGQGGGVWYGGYSAPLFERCVFAGNRANVGGGAFVINSEAGAVFHDCVFTGNSAEAKSNGLGGNGAGFYALDYRFTLEDCLLVDNTASGRGGGVRAYVVSFPSTIRGCTIASNSAFTGGGVLVDSLSTVSVENCILASAHNGGGLVRHADAALTVSCTDIFGNFGGNGVPAGAVDNGGNFALDPLFCGAGAAPDYHLQDLSPCAPGHHPTGAACGQIGALPPGCGAR